MHNRLVLYIHLFTSINTSSLTTGTLLDIVPLSLTTIQQYTTYSVFLEFNHLMEINLDNFALSTYYTIHIVYALLY